MFADHHTASGNGFDDPWVKIFEYSVEDVEGRYLLHAVSGELLQSDFLRLPRDLSEE